MSEYRNVVEGDGVTALEWETNGTVDGRTVTYQGVTVLEGDDDGIRRSCAYFDPSRLGAAIVER